MGEANFHYFTCLNYRRRRLSPFSNLTMVNINELTLQCFLLNGGPPSKFEPELPELIVKADFLRYLESLSAGQLTLEENCSDWERLLLGVSALHLFLQCNVVGPIPVIGDDLHERISRVIARARPNVAEDDPSTSRAALNLDGESAYPLVNFPHLLLVAKDAFSSIALFSTLKMVVRTTVAKIDKKYGEAAPSENAKAEVALMKTYLTDIEGRINAKKGKEQ